MLAVDTCETINESMVQLVFQLVIIFTSDRSKPLSTLQILVTTWSLLMASKGPAEDFLATRMKRHMKESRAIAEKSLDLDKEDNDTTNMISFQKTSRNQPGKGANDVKTKKSETEVQYYHQLGFGKKVPLLGSYSLGKIKLHRYNQPRCFD